MTVQESDSIHVLDALGNQTRRDILALLHHKPLAVNEISQRFPISRPAISKHLRILHQAGLVSYHTAGTRNLFQIDLKGFASARNYLDQFWDDALANFQQVANEWTADNHE